jgi:hypothetical protein
LAKAVSAVPDCDRPILPDTHRGRLKGATDDYVAIVRHTVTGAEAAAFLIPTLRLFHANIL